jgi:hydrogenase maturation factor
MCLAIPKRVIKIQNNKITVEIAGKKTTLKSLVNVKIGDYVISKDNIIIEKISKAQAEKFLENLK